MTQQSVFYVYIFSASQITKKNHFKAKNTLNLLNHM